MALTTTPPNSDPTQELSHRLSNPLAWASVKRNVPLFKPHTRQTKKGGKDTKITVHESDLAGIMAKTADVIPVYLGHVNLAKPEADDSQPPLVGYASNKRVGRWGDENEPGILFDIHLLPEHYAEAKDCPFRSVDFYLDGDGGSIASVALLKRKPALDLGVVTYRDRRPIVQYAFGVEDMADEKKPFGEEKEPSGERPEGEPGMAREKTNTTGIVDDDGELTAEHKALAEHYMAHAMKSHPMMQYLAKCYEAGLAGGAAMGPTNAEMPEPGKKADYAALSPAANKAMWAQVDDAGGTEGGVRGKGKGGEKGGYTNMKDEWHSQMQTDQPVVQYAKLERENRDLQTRLTAIERDGKMARAKMAVLQYQSRDFEMLDEDVDDLMDLDEGKWPKFFAKVEKTRRQSDPVTRRVPYSADGMVPLTGNVAVRTGKPDLHAAPKGHDQALQYMRSHAGVQYDDALSHITNGVTDN